MSRRSRRSQPRSSNDFGSRDFRPAKAYSAAPTGRSMPTDAKGRRNSPTRLNPKRTARTWQQAALELTDIANPFMRSCDLMPVDDDSLVWVATGGHRNSMVGAVPPPHLIQNDGCSAPPRCVRMTRAAEPGELVR